MRGERYSPDDEKADITALEAIRASGCPGIEDIEKQVWVSVLHQALADYFDPNSKLSPDEEMETVRFLFDRHGPWAESRDRCCFAAGIDPTAFEDQARAMRAVKQGGHKVNVSGTRRG